MQINFSALSGTIRKAWLQVVVSPSNESLGFASVRVRALPQLHFSTLWGELTTAESEHETKKTPASIEALRVAQDRMIRAMVIDHDPQTFEAKCPDEVPNDLILSTLQEMGFSLGEAQQALKEGVARKPFSRGTIEIEDQPFEGASEEVANFYRYCQPYGIFLRQLLMALGQFQNGFTESAEKQWVEYKKQHTALKLMEKAERQVYQLLGEPSEEEVGKKVRSLLYGLVMYDPNQSNVVTLPRKDEPDPFA